MRVGQPAVDLLHHVHGQDVAVRLARKLVGAVRGAHGDRQRIDFCGAHERHRLRGVGQKLVAGDLALDAVAVLLLAAAVLQRAEHAKLALDRGADPVREIGHAAGNSDVILVGSGRLAVGLERAVHHHRGEAVLQRGCAGRLLVAVILMQAQRNVRIHRLQRVDHLRQHDVAGVAARAARGLQDDRRIGVVGRLHDGEPLLHVVDVEGGHAVAVFGGVIEQLSKRDAGHGLSSACPRWSADVIGSCGHCTQPRA